MSDKDVIERNRIIAEKSAEIESLRSRLALCELERDTARELLKDKKAQLAEVERDAARYRFIKQWARRLDITGYSLTNNEHFEPRIDEAMAIASQPSSADVERRPCTCHPDDNPPVPCPRMYALQDCRRAAALAAEIESLRARMADMQGERDAAELSRDAAHARLAERERLLDEASPRQECDGCGREFRWHQMFVEEGDRWECAECWDRCEKAERAAMRDRHDDK